jgi:hypothetical protein
MSLPRQFAKTRRKPVDRNSGRVTVGRHLFPRVIGSVARRFCKSLPNAEAKLTGEATGHACLSGLFSQPGTLR